MPFSNILLIDDDVEDQEIFSSALSAISNQLQCIALTSGREALDKLITNELNPDIIFLDLNMPVMSGQEFLNKIKVIEHLKKIPVIIFSTSSNASTIESTIGLGAITFITKPNRFDILVDILKSLIK